MAIKVHAASVLDRFVVFLMKENIVSPTLLTMQQRLVRLWPQDLCLVLRTLRTVELLILARQQRNAALICTGMHIVNINALIPGGEFAPLGILLPIMRIRRNAAALAIVAPLKATPWWTQGMG